MIINFLHFLSVQIGSQNEFTVSKSVIKLKEGHGDRDPCKNYDYSGYLNCLQDAVRCKKFSYICLRDKNNLNLFRWFDFRLGPISIISKNNLCFNKWSKLPSTSQLLPWLSQNFWYKGYYYIHRYARTDFTEKWKIVNLEKSFFEKILFCLSFLSITL